MVNVLIIGDSGENKHVYHSETPRIIDPGVELARFTQRDTSRHLEPKFFKAKKKNEKKTRTSP